MKLIQELNKNDVRVVVYENTISHNPNPYYTVECFKAGVKQAMNTACWSLNNAISAMDKFYTLLTAA